VPGARDRQDSGPADFLLAAAAFAAALAVRALTWPSVFTPGGLRLVDPDAYYHLRRIQWSVAGFPDVLTRDPYVAFPRGGEPIWTPLFDLAIAGAARLAGAAGDPAAVERLAVWVPPLLGATTVAATFLVARRVFGRRAGIVAAAVLCVLPAHVHYSQIGFVDHHVAVALGATLLLAALFGWVARPQAWLPAVLVGCAAAACLGVWPGAILHVGLAQAVLLAGVLASPDAQTAARRAAGVAIAHGVAFLWLAPFAAGRSWEVWGDMSPLVLSGFQPLWLGLPVLGFGACAFAWQGDVLARSRGARATAVAIALGLPALLACAAPAVRTGLVDSATWLLRTESFQAVVSESLPLFSDGRELTVRRAHRALSPLLWALPLLLVALAAAHRRRAEHRTLAFWTAALFAASLAQYRFSNSFSVAWALALGCGLDLGWRALAGRPKAVRVGAAVAAAAAAVPLLLPILDDHARAWGTARRAFAGERVHAPEIVTHHESLVAAATWLRDHSPPTSGWSAAGTAPEYGVLGAWGDGHVVRYVARRPVVQDNFGDDVGSANFADAERYFAAPDEDEALGIATRLGVRYVLVREAGSGHAPRPYATRSMHVRLHRLRGTSGNLETADHPDAPRFAPALSHHRLVYESPRQGDEDGRYKLYEIVAGARVEGAAEPGALVEARLSLAGPGDRRLDYRSYARASHEGRYELTLPYPSEPFEGQLSAGGPWVIESEGAVALLRVAEAAVRDGTRVAGPSLAGPS